LQIQQFTKLDLDEHKGRPRWHYTVHLEEIGLSCTGSDDLSDQSVLIFWVFSLLFGKSLPIFENGDILSKIPILILISDTGFLKGRSTVTNLIGSPLLASTKLRMDVRLMVFIGTSQRLSTGFAVFKLI
jgi:hypothetical protein